MSKLMDSIDLVVFVLVLLFVGFVLGTGLGVGHDTRDTAMEDLEEAEVVLEQALVEQKYSDDPGAAIVEEAVLLPRGVRADWLPESTPVALSADLFRHPGALADLIEGRDLALRFSKPVDLVLDASPGLIRLAWSRPEGDTIEATSHRVYRSSPGEGEKMIAEVEGALRIEDRNVRPGQRYLYHVSAVTKDPAMVRNGREESDRAGPVEVRAARDFEIVALRAAEDGSSARFLVRKLIAGVWHEKEFDAAVNGEVGSADPGSGVDYGTKSDFLRVEVEAKKLPQERDEVSFDAQGRVLLEAGQPITRRVAFERVVETRWAVLRNELGEEEKVPFASP